MLACRRRKKREGRGGRKLRGMDGEGEGKVGGRERETTKAEKDHHELGRKKTKRMTTPRP